MRISDWSSDVCSSDLIAPARRRRNAMAPIRCSYAAAAPASRGEVALTSFDRDCDLVRLNGRIERLMLPVGEHQLQGVLARLQVQHGFGLAAAEMLDLDRKSTSLNSSQ